MPYDEKLADRVRTILGARKDLVEKKMFGGLAFMLNGHMCVGVTQEDLMVRVGADAYQSALEKPHARPMDFTGRPLKGFVYVDGDRCDPQCLGEWVRASVEYISSLPPK